MLPISLRLCKAAAGILLVAAVAACSGVQPLDSETYAGYSPRVELDAVPWYPADPYQCGPQSLAALLTASGVDTAPESLVSDIYVPDRQGSFAPELSAAARARGRMPHRVGPELEDLVEVLADGHPVLVLQNVGLGVAPTWHFAVVVGYDRAENTFLLRSGSRRELEMSAPRFERRWRLGEHWAIALLDPGELPAWVELEEYETQLAYLEGSWSPYLESIYRRMLVRWPESKVANLGMGNLAFGRGELRDAESHYRRVLSLDENHIAALNNLAEVYARRGQLDAALMTACRALRLASGHPLESSVSATVEAIREKRPHTHCPGAPVHAGTRY